MLKTQNRWTVLLVGAAGLLLAGCSEAGADLFWQLVVSTIFGGLLPGVAF